MATTAASYKSSSIDSIAAWVSAWDADRAAAGDGEWTGAPRGSVAAVRAIAVDASNGAARAAVGRAAGLPAWRAACDVSIGPAWDAARAVVMRAASMDHGANRIAAWAAAWADAQVAARAAAAAALAVA